MKPLLLKKSTIKSGEEIAICGSKSETNRLLILSEFFNLSIENQSNSQDTDLLQKALKSNEPTIDIHHAGTAMRFLTAFFASKPNREVLLTGSDRMKQRPIKELVDALKQLGADIQYTENQGFPPLKINGKKLKKSEVFIKSDISSQYISALLLIAPQLENGLTIHLEGEIVSLPYLEMSISVLCELGVEMIFNKQKISILPIKKISQKTFIIESDWSSASYFYSFVALSELGTSLILKNFKKNSWQGDSILREIYHFFGVKTTFLTEQKIILTKENHCLNKEFSYNCTHCPDIAQTLAVTCLGLGINCQLNGLQTLKIKETDRISALENELKKLGSEVISTNNSIRINPKQLSENVIIKTYNDHRMAMAFAPLSSKISIGVDDAQVVEKSYPNFWEDCQKIGIEIQ